MEEESTPRQHGQNARKRERARVNRDVAARLFVPPAMLHFAAGRHDMGAMRDIHALVRLPSCRLAAYSLAGLLPLAAAGAFRESFDGPTLALDPAGERGWAYFTGDGEAVLEFSTNGHGQGVMRVDATRDRRNIWWALIKRQVSDRLDLAQLEVPGRELRVTARVRVSDAPRRINLHVNTQRTDDFHSHLLEFDIPRAGEWFTVSMTTRDFEARPGDQVFAQLAMMDWGRGRYAVEIDDYTVDIVDLAIAGPDVGGGVPYHPPVPPPEALAERVRVAHDSIVDREYPELNFNTWVARGAEGRSRPVLAVGGTQYSILRWELSAYAGRRVQGGGVLELTTHALEQRGVAMKDFGEVRVVEILDGDPAWDQDTVTLASLCAGQPVERVFNPQMVIDAPIEPAPGGVTRISISAVVLQRLIDGRTRSLALIPLGAVHASLLPVEADGGAHAAALCFNLEAP